MILKAIFKTIFNKKLLATVMLASTAALAQAQSDDSPVTSQKRLNDKAQDVGQAIEVKSETAAHGATAAVSKIDDTKTEGTPTPLSAKSGKNAATESPFAKSITEKPASALKQGASGSGWEFAVTPYLYMTGLSGTIGARGRTTNVDLSFGDIFENLNLGLMGTVEARKGRFVVVNDLMWIKLGEERDTPGELFSSVKVGVNMFIWDPEVGYRLYEGDGGNFDVLGGVRIMSVETNINFRAGILPATDASERKTWATPVIGAHGTVNLSPKFYLATKFDVGGGIGADFTGQFYGGLGYRITPKIALVGGYRYLKTDYDSEAGFLFDTSMNGIVIGAKFAF